MLQKRLLNICIALFVVTSFAGCGKNDIAINQTPTITITKTTTPETFEASNIKKAGPYEILEDNDKKTTVSEEDAISASDKINLENVMTEIMADTN